MRIGVFLPNWIGDVAMSTPTLRALRKHVGRHGRMVGVMRPYVEEVLAGNPWIDKAVCYQKKDKASVNAAVNELRGENLDAIILLTNSLRTAWIARRTRVARRIGYAREGRGLLLTTKLYEPVENGRISPLPQIDSYLNLAYAFGCDWESPRLELATTAEDEKLSDAVWQQLGLEGHEVAVLNSGGAFGAAKDWPAEHFAELANRLANERNMHVLVNCGPKERETARQIASRANDPRVVSLADEPNLPIGLTKAIIRRSKLLVTTDSGPRFFGVAFQVPTVSLFGPTSTRWTNTHSEFESRVSLDLDCAPCMKRICPLKHHRCMKDLSVELVMSRIDQQLASQSNRDQAA